MSGESTTNYDSGSETSVTMYKTKGKETKPWMMEVMVECINYSIA
jgi:hypothetical protein